MKLKVAGALSRVLAVRGEDDGEWFINALSDALEKPRSADNREAGYMHASLLDHECDLHVGYRLAGVNYQTSIASTVKKRFEAGEDYEARVIQRAESAGLLVHEYMEATSSPRGRGRPKKNSPEPEIVWKGKTQEIPDLRIRFTPDLVIRHPIGNYLVIVECKSANANSFRNYKDNPNPAHVDRTNLYMAGTGIHRAYILYGNKDSHQEAIHPITFDPVKWEQKRLRAIRIREQVDAGEMPERTELSFGGCLKCPYYRPCLADTTPSELAEETGGMLPNVVKLS